jgi:hypothetical protein
MVCRAPIAVGACRQHHQGGPQPLAAAGYDVLGHLLDQRHTRMQTGAYNSVYRLHVRSNKLADRFYGHNLHRENFA